MRKLNNKGFTVIELIATVIILVIVMTIAITSINTVSKKVRQNQYNNLIEYIKAKSYSYFNDTGTTKAFVQTLIENGYVDADDESKNIYSPLDNEILNCYLITKSEENVSVDYNEECDYDLLAGSALSITYCLGNNCTPSERVDKNTWLNSQYITLGVVKNDPADPLDLNTSTYTWINPLAPDAPGHNKTYVVNINDNSALNDRFDLILQNNGSNYTTSTVLKVDRVKPTVILSLASKDRYYNTRTITYTITGSDTHSGPAQACLSTTNSSSGCTWYDLTNKKYTGEYTFAAREGSGETYTLYAFVKDAAGNISAADSKSYKIYEECSLVNNTTWVSGTVCSATQCNKSGTYNRLAYDEYTGARCANNDRSSGGDPCEAPDCCSQWHWEDGSSCSNKCGWGTYNRKKVSDLYESENKLICGSESSGGSECYKTTGCPEDDDDDDCGWSDYYKDGCTSGNRQIYTRYDSCSGETQSYQSGVCTESGGTWEEDSCSSNGYVIEKNTSTGATRTTTSTCKGAYYNCSWTSCSSGRQYARCSYKVGGSAYTETIYSVYISCNDYTDEIWAYRCLEEQALFITDCQPQSTGAGAMCKVSDGTYVTRAFLSDTYYSNGNSCKVQSSYESGYCSQSYTINTQIYYDAYDILGKPIKCDMSYMVKNGRISSSAWTSNYGWYENGKYYCNSQFYFDKIDKSSGRRFQDMGCSNWRYCNCFFNGYDQSWCEFQGTC